MKSASITVVIPTFNRSGLVQRAIASAASQLDPADEIVVVDDGSSDDTAEVIGALDPPVRFVRQPKNAGLMAARTRGLAEATRPWVLMLDDDDELLPGALVTIRSAIAELRDDQYPVLNFASTHTMGLDEAFAVLDAEAYLAVIGDRTPVIDRERFAALGLEYPAMRLGGDDLLWTRVAATTGIPTWSRPVLRVHADAPTRLSHVGDQLAQARSFALLQEAMLEQLGDVLPAAEIERRRLGAATYWLIAGDRARSLHHLGQKEVRHGRRAAALRVLARGPTRLTELLFRAYRYRIRRNDRRRLRTAARARRGAV